METRQTLFSSPTIWESMETDNEFDLDIRLVPHVNQLQDVNASVGDSDARTCLSCPTDCQLCK